MRDERVQFANTLRGMAALCVLISHYTFVFWTSREAVAGLIHGPTLPDQFAFPNYLRWLHLTVPQFNWGAFGVALFFLVSGFVIPFSLRSATWKSFLVGRFFRIVPLYMVGFSVTLMAIWLVGRHFDMPWPFSISHVLAHYVPGLRDIFLLPSIDGIVWTLEIEIKFYLICALAIVGLRRGSKWIFVIPAALGACEFYIDGNMAAWAVVSPSMHTFGLIVQIPIPFLIFMFIGVAFHYLHNGWLKGEVALFLVGSLFLLFAATLVGAMPQLGASAWTYGFAVVVFAFAASFPQLFPSRAVGDFFADISYPLYVIHGVAGYAALRVLLDLGMKAWVSLAVVSVGAVGLAWILHVIVEVPSHNFGKRLADSRRMPSANPSPSSMMADCLGSRDM